MLVQVKPADRAAISGLVVKMGSGEPVAKARVTLSAYEGRGASYQATTIAGGQFVFQNLEPGKYRLSVTRGGYVRMEYGARSPNRPGLPINVLPGQNVKDLVLPILPAGTIAGRVFDRDGEPLASVNVQAFKYTYQEGQRVMSPVQGARTNDLGEYRLFWLQPGQYFVSATPPDLPRIGGGGRGGQIAAQIIDRLGGRGVPIPQLPTPGEAESDEGYIPVYYPGTTDAQSAAPINVPAGVVFSGVDMTVATTRTLRVRGQVINGPTGQLVRNANVMLLPRQRAGGFRFGMNGNFRNRNINDQGAFEISGVVPGSYDLVAILNDRTNRMSARVPIEVGNSDVDNVALVLTTGFQVAGRLAIEGRPASDNDPELAKIRVMLRPDLGMTQMGGAPPASPVQPNGTFALQQVGAGDYRLTVTGMPRNAYVKMARLGGIDILNSGLHVDRQPTGELQVLVSPNTAALDGTVTDEKQEPAINVTIVLVPDPAHRTRWDLYRTVSTDALGKFHVEGVAPGDYKVFAWEDVETGAWQDPDFIRAYEDRGKAVRLGEGAQSNIELKVIPPQV